MERTKRALRKTVRCTHDVIALGNRSHLLSVSWVHLLLHSLVHGGQGALKEVNIVLPMIELRYNFFSFTQP